VLWGRYPSVYRCRLVCATAAPHVPMLEGPSPSSENQKEGKEEHGTEFFGAET